MIRRATAVLVALSAIGPAAAGDFAERSIIGFTSGGERFAFEEFGVQAGSGFPYSNIFVIDTAADRWVPGSPVRVRFDDETAVLAAVRAKAAVDAAPLMSGFDQPGDLLASNPITESGRDPHRLVFKRHPAELLANPDLELRLELVPLKAAQAFDDTETFGFRLILKDGNGERVLHQDDALPASRGIALDYRIHDVVMLQPFGRPATLAVVIMVLRKGFEGPDGRFLAVTARLPG